MRRYRHSRLAPKLGHSDMTASVSHPGPPTNPGPLRIRSAPKFSPPENDGQPPRQPSCTCEAASHVREPHAEPPGYVHFVSDSSPERPVSSIRLTKEAVGQRWVSNPHGQSQVLPFPQW